MKSHGKPGVFWTVAQMGEVWMTVKYFSVSKVFSRCGPLPTPPKTNMMMEKQPFEDVPTRSLT